MFKRLKTKALKARHYGTQRYCPICDSHLRRFEPAGVNPRPDAMCPVCNSLERHRLLWLFLQQRSPLFDGTPRKLLHFAPEHAIANALRQIPNVDYVSADLFSSQAMIVLDVTQIDRPDNTYAVILCSHVLEHVPDDRQALRELHRVLTPGGLAILQVPITEETTIEDPSVTDPQERLRRFGNHDHVRAYGPDVVDRMTAAGFEVASFQPQDITGHPDLAQLAVKKESVFSCRKAPRSSD